MTTPPPFYPYETHVKHIAERLKQSRRNEGLTVKDVAKELGITMKLYKSWESGEEAIIAGHLARCAKVFDMGMAAFFPEPQPSIFTVSHEDLSVYNSCNIEIQKMNDDFWSVIGTIENGRYNYLGDFLTETAAQQFISRIWNPHQQYSITNY